jgi:NADH-quinone oxidoreductase subunit B
VALTPDEREAAPPGALAADAPPAADAGSLVAAPPGDVMAPIVVPNTLWTSDSPGAYASTAPTSTHLTRFEKGDLELADTARWGQLEVIPTKADILVDLIRMNSLWPLLSGLACCAFEMMSGATSKNDMDRWGMFPFRASPRQADVLIVAGTLTTKMAGPLLRLWEQMPEPKWCVAMGDCTCSGGRYKRSYSTIEGIDRVMPVDVYVPGCPPRPEGLIYGMMKLGQLVKERRGSWPDRAVRPSVPEDI